MKNGHIPVSESLNRTKCMQNCKDEGNMLGQCPPVRLGHRKCRIPFTRTLTPLDAKSFMAGCCAGDKSCQRLAGSNPTVKRGTTDFYRDQGLVHLMKATAC
jgi:hypothetical protein